MKEKISPKEIILQFLKYASLFLGAFVAIIPLVVVLFASFKTNTEFANGGVLELPQNWLNFENYKMAFLGGNMLRGFMNTAIILTISMIGTVMTGTMTAYVLNRFKFKSRKIVNTVFLLATLIPGVTMQISTFQIISNLGLFNTMWSTILLFMGTDIIAIYIFVQHLENVPYSIDESAIMDGASYFTIFFRVLFPLLKPAIVTVLVIKGVGCYNEFYTPFLYMPKKELAVISTALFKFKGPYGSKWEVISAGVIITIIPTLIIFILLQKQIYSGMAAGSVKE